MKYLLLLVVIAVALWMFSARRRPPPGPDAGKPGTAGKPEKPAPMLECAHCGVHLPQSEALNDVAGRAYCTAAHRIAGPR